MILEYHLRTSSEGASAQAVGIMGFIGYDSFMDADVAIKMLEDHGLGHYSVVRITHNLVALNEDKTQMVKIYGNLERAEKDRALLSRLEEAGVCVKNAKSWLDEKTALYPIFENNAQPIFSQLGHSLGILHSIEDARLHFDWEDITKGGIQAVNRMLLSYEDQILADELVSYLNQTHRRFLSLMSRDTRPQSLLHGDMTRSNMLCAKDKTVLIDFELSRLGPREWDFGSLLFTKERLGELSDDNWDELIESYDHPLNKTLLEASKDLWEARYVVWMLRKSETDKLLLDRWRACTYDVLLKNDGQWNALIPLLAPFRS